LFVLFTVEATRKEKKKKKKKKNPPEKNKNQTASSNCICSVEHRREKKLFDYVAEVKKGPIGY